MPLHLTLPFETEVTNTPSDSRRSLPRAKGDALKEFIMYEMYWRIGVGTWAADVGSITHKHAASESLLLTPTFTSAKLRIRWNILYWTCLSSAKCQHSSFVFYKAKIHCTSFPVPSPCIDPRLRGSYEETYVSRPTGFWAIANIGSSSTQFAVRLLYLRV